ncbi:MAG TPA: ROK family protein [Propionicimonas sp.]|nr:ROK family protein [Propionicimonas sp.]HRA05640.1 ROK family protein [Propionicimonas sp.]
MSRFHVALSTPTLAARLGRESVASLAAKLIASRSATSRAEIGRATGLSRSTVDAGVETLLRLGAIRAAGLHATPGRGRPAETLELAPTFGVILAADCGATLTRVCAFDLGQRVLGEREIDLRIDSGPEPVLAVLVRTFEELLADTGLAQAPRTVVVGLPGPVDYWGGTVVRPPIMPGWDGFPVVAHLEESLGASAVLENDVNLRALGEARSAGSYRGPLLYLKVGSGIGAGIIGSDGAIFRGADGAAGDIGHLRIAGSTAECACGATGCLEALASVRAIGSALGLQDRPDAALVEQVLDLVRRHNRRTITLVRERAEHIGDIAVSLIHCFNPERVVVGGRLALASDDLLAGIRSIVYRRALPLATRTLTIARPKLGMASGTAGALAIGIETALEPEAIAGRMAARSKGRD